MKKMNNVVWWSLFVGLLAIGFFLRVRQLVATDYWYDEAFTAIVIRAPWKEMWAYLAADKIHPPLFYVLLRGWISLFGTSLAAIRSLSLLFGMAILPMIYAITQKLHVKSEEKQQFGLTIMAFFTLSPFFATYSVEARSYSFLAFLILVSVYFFIEMTNKLYVSSWNTVAFLLAIIAIGLTHYLSILVIFGYVVAYALLVMIEKKWFYDAKIWTKISGVLVFSWIGFTALWHSFNLEKLVSGMNLGWIPQADLSTIIRVVYAFLFGVDRQSLGIPTLNQFSFPLLSGTVGLLILIASAIAIAFAVKKSLNDKDQLGTLVIVLSLGIVPLLCILLASSLGVHVYVDRYVIGYGTMLLLSFGYSWWLLVGKDFQIGLVTYAVLLLFIVLPKNSTKYTEIYNTLSIYGNNVVVESPIDFVVLKAYFGKDKVKLLHRPEGIYYDWALIAHSEEKKENELAPNSFVVISKYASRAPLKSWIMKQEIGEYVVWEVVK